MPSDPMPPVEVFDIVQIDPAYPGVFGGCLMVVTEIRGWGLQGYVTVPNGGDAYYRVRWGGFETTGGKAVWRAGDEPQDGEGGDDA